MRRSRNAFLVVSSLVSALLVAASLAARYVGWRHQVASEGAAPLGVIAVLDVNGEASVPAWWTSGLLLTAAITAGLLAALPAPAVLRRGWGLLAAGLALLSLDEVVALHERLGALGAAVTAGGVHFAWVVPGALAAAAALTVLAVALRTAPRSALNGLGLAAAVFLIGAVGLETVSGVVLQAHGDRAGYLLVTAAEEGAEMLGAGLAVWALLGAVRVEADPTGWRVTARARSGCQTRRASPVGPVATSRTPVTMPGRR